MDEATTDEARTGSAEGPSGQKQAERDNGPPDAEEATRAADDSIRDLRVPTWELELLISGAVVFTLFRVPAVLARELSQAVLHFPESLFLFVFLGVVYLQTAAYVLMASFIFHLAARAYWIGLIGLYSIFPGGVGWDNVKTGPRLREVYRKQLPGTPVLIRQAGNLCSGIFSFSFSIVIIILYSAIGAGVMFGTSLALQVLFFPDAALHVIFYVILSLIFLPYVGLMSVDKLFAGKTLGPRSERLVSRALEVYTNLFGSKLVNSIQMTFFSNVKRRYVYPIFYVIFFGGLLLTLARVTLDLGVVEVSGFDHYPSVHDQVVAQSAFYRDQARSDDARSATRPSIQGDVVEGPYVKLFLPHTPRSNDALAEVCPGLEPLRGRSVVRLVPRDSKLDPDLVEKTRACLADLWAVALDGEPLRDLHFEFHVRQPLAVRGLLTYLPTADLAPGRHLLRLERRRASDDEESEGTVEAALNDSGGDADDDLAIYEIPFWI